MISQNDLYDIAYALVLIRLNTQYKLNRQVLAGIISVLEDEGKTFGDNSIRRALAAIEGLDREYWHWVYHENVYVNHRRQMDNGAAYRLLVTLCKELERVLGSEDWERAYDLADCFHCLPGMLADDRFLVPNDFWTVFVKSYRKKWDRAFLMEEERAMRYHAVQKIWQSPSIFQRYACPHCHIHLHKIEAARIVDPKSPEDTSFISDIWEYRHYKAKYRAIKFTWTELQCPVCKQTYSLRDIKRMEKTLKD